MTLIIDDYVWRVIEQARIKSLNMYPDDTSTRDAYFRGAILTLQLLKGYEDIEED